MEEEEVRFSWKAEAVLADEYYRSVESVPMFAAEVEDKKRISVLVKYLTDRYPLGRLQHLKRVGQVDMNGSKKMLVLIKSCENDESYSTIKELLTEEDLRSGLGSEVYTYHVPRYAPLTRKQFEESIALWPTQFHENKHIAKVISGDIFNGTDCSKMQELMRHAISAAKMASAIAGAVVVDPSSGEIIAVASDERIGHPLHHAVMVAIAKVAEGQRNAIPQRGSKKNSDSPCEAAESRSTNVPYLCTGYDLYVTREPCTMCAMALVHSRISRVFYGTRTDHGALGSLLKLHTHRMLNHRYQVWRGICLKECQEIP